MTHNNSPGRNPRQGDFISRAGTTMTIIGWLLFLGILFGVFDYFVSQRHNPNQDLVTNVTGFNREIVLQRNPYGHYVSNGTINNHDVVFLLDTGATDIAIPESLAIRIGLDKEHTVYVKTANGNVKAYRTRLNSVSLGELTLNDVRATILTNIEGDEILLGMTFLKHFELLQKGKTLTIRQPL